MTRNITQEINDWIASKGRGDIRNALNIALCKLEASDERIKILQEEIKELQNELHKLGVEE